MATGCPYIEIIFFIINVVAANVPCMRLPNKKFFTEILASNLICVITNQAQFLSPLLAPLALPLPGGLFFCAVERSGL